VSAPWLKFYPSDWRADPALRMCSIAARGLWMEMLCIMHEATPRGSLRINGRPVSDRQMATLAGVTDVAPLFGELEDAGVFSREEDGTIYSRRMMRDEEKAAQDKANGKQGGNPTLKPGVNPPDKAQIPETRNQKAEEKKEGRSQATRLPADWTLPNDWLQDALRAGMDIPQALASAARMHNWSLSDMKGKKLDWRATWRNWFQRDLPKPHSTASPAPRNAGERAFLRLQAENGHDPTDTISKRLEPGDGRRQIEGNGDAWPVAGAQGAFGRN
jgi:hypothetical protein